VPPVDEPSLDGVRPERPRRACCGRCRLPLASCLCHLVAAVDNEIELLVLQHPREAREAKGSVRLLALSLARCRVVVGERFDAGELARLLHGDGRRSVLLYPESEALRPARADAAATRPTQLVVLDGTWRKSLRMLMVNEALRRLPRRALAPSAPAAYGTLRKAREPSQLSTLEAACAALAAIEDAEARYAGLLRAFGRFVDERVARRPGGR
jgi:DTW domain-containing protein YfiP